MNLLISNYLWTSSISVI